MHLATLRTALERETNENVGVTCQDEEFNIIGPPPKFHGTRDNLRSSVRTTSWCIDPCKHYL